jgi:hypothetical protein
MMPRSRLGRMRVILLDANAVEFARLAQVAGCRTLTASRLRKIESGELKPRPEERRIIGELLGVPGWEATG